MDDITRILIVEDMPSDYELAQREIRRSIQNCVFERVEKQSDFLKALNEFQPDIILSDYKLAAFDGMKALELAQKHMPSAPVIIWTGAMSQDVAVDCMKKGASNYILKENIKRLGPAIVHALEERRMLLERKQAELMLKESEEKWRSLVNITPDYIALFDRDARYLYLNHYAEGFSEKDVIGNSVYEFLAPESRELFKSKFDACLTTGITQRFEYMALGDHGSLKAYEQYLVCIHNKNKDVNVMAVARDITERRQSDQMLLEREERFRALIENGLDDISLLDASGNLIWESPAVVRNLGYVSDQFRGQNIFKLMHPDDLAWAQELFIKLIQEPGSRQHQFFRLRHSDGTWRWVEAVVSNMLNDSSVKAIVVNYRDITERRQAEEALRESQTKYQNLVETSHDLIWSIDGDGKFTFINHAAKQLYGYEPEELIGRSFFEFMDPQHYHRDLKQFKESIVNIDESKDVESYVRHRDGRLLILSANSRVMRDEHGNVTSVTGTSHDITEQKQAELEIQQRNEDLALINALNEVINRGEGLDAVVNLMTKEVKRLLSGGGVTIYLLNPDGRSLKMRQYFLPPETSRKIEKIIGRAIPAIEIPIRDGGYFQEVLLSRQGRITSDPDVIQKWMGEFVETSSIPAVARGAIRKLIPQIFKLLNIKSTILIPLIWEEKAIGLLDVSSPNIFSMGDLKRIENIGGQLTTAIRRQQVDDALKTERNLLRTLIDNVPDRIYTMDMQGRKTLSNTADWKASGGKTMEDIIGKTDFDTYPPELAEQFWKLDRAVLDSGKPVVNFEEPGLDFDGNLVSILTTKIPLRDDKGNVIGLVGVGRDITERKQAEESVRMEREKAQNYLDIAGVMMLALDQDGRVTLINQKGCEILGYSYDEIMGTNWINTFLPDAIRNELHETFQQLISGKTEQPAYYENAVLTKNGRERLIAWHNTVLRDSQGVVISTLSSGEDITERRRAELERQVLLEIMQGLANTNDLYEFLKLIHNSIAKVIYADNFFVVMHQQESGLFEEIYSVDQFDPPAPPASLEKSITSYVFRSKEPLLITRERFNELALQGEVELVGTNSESWLGIPLKTTNGTIGVIAVQDYENPNRYSERDKDFLASIASQVALAIERKQAEEMLRESEERFGSAFEYASIGMGLLTLEGQWFKVNRAICEMLGYSEAELLTLTFHDITHPDDLESDLNHVLQLLSGEINSYQMEKRYFHKLGHVIWALLSVSLVRNNEGKPLYFISQIQDVTERRQAENAEREQRALAEALRDTANTLNSNLDYGEVLDHILAAVGGVVPHDAGTIMLIDKGFVHVVRSRGYNERGFNTEIMEIELPLAETINLRQMVETGKPVVISDTQSYAGWKKLSSTDWLRSNVGAPIIIYGEVIGFILLDSETVGFFTPVHAERLEAFANQAAIAIHNSRLLQQAQEEIRERKLAEEALRESEAIYRQAIEVAGSVPYYESYYDNGRSIKYEFIGEGIRQITGYGPEEFNATLWDSLVEEVNLVEDLAGYSLDEGIQRVRSGDNPIWKCEHRIRDRDGKIHWVFEAAVELRDENGVSRGSIGTYQDITMRKQAELELRASEERFRQLADNIEEVFWMTDAETGREIYISPAGEKIWGHSLDYMMHEPDAFMSTIFSEDRSAVLSALEREKSGQKVELEYRVVNPDGSLRWVWDRAFPIFHEDGRVKTLAGIAADITERKKAEFETRHHLAELEALYENGLAVGQLLEPEQIGNRIIETFARHLSWHHVAIRLLPTGTDEMQMIAFSQPGLSDEEKIEVERHFNKTINKVGQGLSGWVVQTGEPLRTGDVHAHPQYVNTYPGILSGLYMPLKIAGRTIGCISVESEQANAFTMDDERLLATLANQAAVAFENARLYQTVQVELSERKRIEDALRTSETHYRDLADSITDVLFELDQNIRFTHWNKASELLIGFAAESVIGRHMSEVIGTSETTLQAIRVFEDVVNNHLPQIFEMSFTLKNQRHTFEVSAYPSTRGVSVVAKDITDRKRTETLLEKRFELMEYSARHDLNEMMQKTVDIVSEMTASHIGFFHFMEEDQNTPGMRTWSTETMLTFKISPAKETHLPLDQAGVWADAARQRRSMIHNDYESLPQRKALPEGHVPIQRELVVPIIRNERLMAVMGIGNKAQDYTKEDVEIVERFADYAWDITERKQMESQLADERNQLARRVEERTADLSRANSNLARALRVKDEFLANMSHELRTPLNAILGLSESLGEQVAGPLNEKQQKYLATINESGHHLLALINDILDLAKIEAGQITLDINKVDINSVCQASLRMVKQLSQKKNQEVVFQIDDDLGLMWADERRLKQMIVNLLSNAVKFTPEAGRLGMEVHGDRTGNKVTITVWDNGIGISSRDMERLFRPFVQLDTGLARETTGTGLGLALVAQMARLHGGSVHAQSNPGEGSRFSIQLPWEPALASDAAIRLRTTGKFIALDPNAKNRPVILLIEDTKEVVMMLVDYLEMAGYKVVTAQDGIDGITQAKLSHPDLILMDIQMPRMDGFEATQKLRNNPEFRDTPIIALTALAMPNDRDRCLEAGMNEHVSKPVNLKALVKMIQKFLLMDRESTP